MREREWTLIGWPKCLFEFFCNIPCFYLVAKLCASLSFPIFQSLLKLMSIESLMPSNHLILCEMVWKT